MKYIYLVIFTLLLSSCFTRVETSKDFEPMESLNESTLVSVKGKLMVSSSSSGRRGGNALSIVLVTNEGKSYPYIKMSHGTLSRQADSISIVYDKCPYREVEGRVRVNKKGEVDEFYQVGRGLTQAKWVTCEEMLKDK